MRSIVLFGLFTLSASGVFSQSRINKELMLTLVNNARANDCKCGSEKQKAAPALFWDEALARAAQKHANDMARKKFFSHTGSDKSTLSDRVDREKFDWVVIGENIAMGHQNEEMAVEGWMKSPGHCKNIMNPEFKYMGAAVSSDGKYWVQVFADKADE